MRIKIIGDSNCARATRHLLRKAGLAVTEFLPAEVVTQAPHSGYAITIDLAPAPHTLSGNALGVSPEPTHKPGHSTHGQPATEIGEALALAKASRGASSPTSASPHTSGDHDDSVSARARHAVPLHSRDDQHAHTDHHAHTDQHARAHQGACIHFDSVDSDLESAILRHVTQLAAAPVIVDRPGGVVHSERELRIIVPNSGDVKADEAAAVAVEFGVLRGLLDLSSPAPPPASRGKMFGSAGKTGAAGVAPGSGRGKSPSESGKKWWRKVFSRTVLKVRGTQAEACATKTDHGMASTWRKVRTANISVRDAIALCEKWMACHRETVFRGAGVPLVLTEEGPAILDFVAGRKKRRRDADATKFATNMGCMLRLALFAFAALSVGSASASPRRAVVSVKPAHVEGAVAARIGAADRAVLLPAAALLPQGQYSTGQAPVKITDGTNTLVVDPCKGQTKLYASINQTANAQLVAGTASKKIYICSIHVVVAVATSVALVEGTGSVCATGTAGVSGFGGATAATGWNFAVNGGIVLGNGDAAVGAEATSADNLCLFNSGSGQVSGGISYVVQ